MTLVANFEGETEDQTDVHTSSMININITQYFYMMYIDRWGIGIVAA